MQYSFDVKTTAHSQLVDITREVQTRVTQSGIKDGIATVFIPHTTAAVTINENADPTVQTDILQQLEKMVPWDQPFYRHSEGNSSAHLKASMMGFSEQILIQNGRLVLGTWQGIYFCEFDGPRQRQAIVRVSA